MTGRWFDSSNSETESRNESRSGLSMTDVLMLPDSQRQIVQWMMRQHQSESTLSEIAVHIGQEETTVRPLMDDLVQQGFVQETAVSGQLLYRIKLAARSKLAEPIQQALTPGSPIAAILNPSGDYAVMAGTNFELRVTVSNKGNQSALIDVYIDDVSQTLGEWCASAYERLALDSNASSEVVFQFQIPPQALPGIYNYLLVVDAPQHYPEDTPIRHSQQLRILPSIEEAVRVSDPTFTVQPVTSSRQAEILQPGQVLQMTVTVYNRSERVDRFWLSCSDLEASWLTVRYPEGLALPGLVTATEGLDLNPDTQGEILLLLHPPLNALAGNYFPTLRVHSANNPDLMLLDVVYLQVLPVYLLTVEFRTLVGKVRRMAGMYEIRLNNGGNTPRELILQAVNLDEDELCAYTLEPEQVRILPGSTALSMLEVQPTKWWRRPFFGGGLAINFGVALEDVQQLSLPNDMPQGTLIWEARPWWQFLLLLLTGLGILGAIAFLIWWFFFKPPALPKIAEFSSSSPVYKEVDGDFIRLNWQISNPKQIQQIRIVGQASDGTIAVQPLVYNFSQGIPNELKQFCAIATSLVCKNVRTDARQPGDYVFEIAVVPKNKKEVSVSSLKSSAIKIIPVEPPKIIQFFSTRPIYEEINTTLPNLQNLRANVLPPSSILLNWRLRNPNQLKELTLVSRAIDGSVNSPLRRYDFSQGIPDFLKNSCVIRDKDELICINIPTEARQPGDYIFELTAIPKKGNGEPSSAMKTDTIKIKSKKIPLRIISFQVNNEPARTKYLIPINPKQTVKLLALSWQVQGSQDTKVELLPAPGLVATNGSILYPLGQQPSRETITLKVSNLAGEEQSKSVTLETFIPPPPPVKPPTVKPTTPPGRAAASTVSPPGSPVPGRAVIPTVSPPGSPVPGRAVLPTVSPPALPVPVLPPVPSPGASFPTVIVPGTSPVASPTPSTASASPSPSPLSSPSPSTAGSLSPSELPPRFD